LLRPITPKWFDPRRIILVSLIGKIKTSQAEERLYAIILNDDGTVGSLAQAACELLNRDRMDLIADCMRKIRRRSVLSQIIILLGETGAPEALKLIEELLRARKKRRNKADRELIRTA